MTRVTSDDRHGHVQIQYRDGFVESLVGFDPYSLEDREFLYRSLDEFIDNHIIPVCEGAPNNSPEHNFFTVSGYVD
jgi:hypothetical protein